MKRVGWLRSRRAVALQGVGIISVSVGFGLIEAADGLIAGGLLLIAVGIAAELATDDDAIAVQPSADVPGLSE